MAMSLVSCFFWLIVQILQNVKSFKSQSQGELPAYTTFQTMHDKPIIKILLRVTFSRKPRPHQCWQVSYDIKAPVLRTSSRQVRVVYYNCFIRRHACAQSNDTINVNDVNVSYAKPYLNASWSYSDSCIDCVCVCFLRFLAGCRCWVPHFQVLEAGDEYCPFCDYTTPLTSCDCVTAGQVWNGTTLLLHWCSNNSPAANQRRLFYQ